MQTATYLKAAISGFCAALASLLGWQGTLALCWVIAMGMDFLSGTFAALKTGTWASAVARQGLWHKAGMILAVAVAVLADVGISTALRELRVGFTWPGGVFALVMVWYTLTELGSILENVVLLGAPVPSWLTKLLKVGLKLTDEAGNQSAKEDGE